MNAPKSLDQLFRLRKDFTIIALTGQTGSGCTTVAKQLERGILSDYPKPANEGKHNSFRKYGIIYRYASENLNSYTLISYREIITLFLLSFDFDKFADFVNSAYLKERFDAERLPSDFSGELESIAELVPLFNQMHELVSKFVNQPKLSDQENAELFNFFFGKEFKNFSDQFHYNFRSISAAKHYQLFHLITNNVRKSGDPFDHTTSDPSKVFTLAEVINRIIKAIRVKSKENPTKIVIDSLRNPFEVMFFKQRYSAFYLFAINREADSRLSKLEDRYQKDFNHLKKLLDLEYEGGKNTEFYKQFVRDCIEKADVHITYRNESDVRDLEEKAKGKNDNTSPYFTWQMQLLKYLTLIEHPGLITPSPEERCMQLAYTAKYNSGCISRQVGAAVTDQHYSIKAIGWNNTPEGQVPCLLRSVEKLVAEDSDDLAEFSDYEKGDEFRKIVNDHYKEKLEKGRQNLKGRNVCFCFKSLHNSKFDGKNQVHTRSLHAEESAFLQLTKYGGVGVKGGKLFSTASPCELCSKKAYQLGIEVIYYIDPYPGIARQHILSSGSKQPELRLFNGAIGNAYHWLYEPLMSMKDELSLTLGLEISDLTKQQKGTVEKLQRENAALRLELEELKRVKPGI